VTTSEYEDYNGDHVELGQTIEMIGGPYHGWRGNPVEYGDHGWVTVDFTGNHIEVPTEMMEVVS
jgi:hypothetical protein